jgi:hypothetical protein
MVTREREARRIEMKSLTVVVLLIGFIAFMAPAAGHAQELQPLMAGWERIFKLTWSPAEHGSKPGVEGYLENVSPYDLTSVRILVDALDGAGQITGQRVAWVPGELRGGARMFFEVPVATAPAYRVRVFSYDRLESIGNIR